MQEILRGLMGPRATIERLGCQTAKQGTEAVENILNQLIECARQGKIDGQTPSDFLESASLEFWQERQSLEPILYLYEKYYLETPIPGDGTDVGFASVMSKIAATTEGKDRQIVIKATIDFFRRHLSDPPLCLTEVLGFAINLKDKNLMPEAKQIATLVNKEFPDLVNRHRFLQEPIQEILETRSP